MRILDSNLWVFAFTGTNRRAANFVEDAISCETEIVLDAYVVNEVLEAFERSTLLQGPETSEAMSHFLKLVRATSCIIQDFSEAERYEYDLELERQQEYNKLLGQILDIQAKDAPILLLASKYYNESPTVYTNDKDFADLTPGEYGLPNIELEYVPDSDEEVSVPEL
ncbi:hypothetical protein [Halorussus pelagicus]|uniref:hypothetical protein n=1 Tax=Halorussus pelagicus TaxID=2505977 RepID=UPI000FFBCC98|nr:hypothetical protein [Halorussus pelagicus]